MKDAFGGSFMLKIMITFFVIFICFMTVAINYAKVFKIKNNVINILERSTVSNYNEAVIKIDEYLYDIGHVYSSANSVYAKLQNNCEEQGGDLTDHGVCIVSVVDGNDYYYKVTAYFVIDFPMFRLGTMVPIMGETKVLRDRRI